MLTKIICYDMIHMKWYASARLLAASTLRCEDHHEEEYDHEDDHDKHHDDLGDDYAKAQNKQVGISHNDQDYHNDHSDDDEDEWL